MLGREIEQWAARLPDRRRLSTLRFDPHVSALLEPRQLERLHRLVTKHFAVVDGGCQAVEVEPSPTVAEQLAVLGGLGFDHLSLHVPESQTLQMTERLVRNAHAAGFSSVQLQVGSGLKTPTTTRATLRRLLRLEPERVGFVEKAHASTASRAGSFVAAARFLETHDYRQVGPHDFVRKDDTLAVAHARGTLTRSLHGYATRAGTETLAVGPGGVSDLGGAYLRNTQRDSQWKRAITRQEAATATAYVRTGDDELRSDAIRDLLCLFQLEKSRLVEHHGRAAEVFWNEAREAFKPLAADGLVRISSRRLGVTPRGRIFLRVIAARLAVSSDKAPTQPRDDALCLAF